MKKIKSLLLVISLVFIFTGCNKESNLKEISYSKLNSMIESKETFFFVVEKDGCHYCEEYIPKLEKVLNDNDVVGYVINISDLSEEEYNKFDEEYNVTGTPTTLFMVNGKESKMQRYEGNVSEDKIISKLKSNNYMK
ncbi:MAG: thioredoxin family protein [Bacilli bacterium]|nr:thioredoxin family protein [Bacilli bacterium]